MRSRSRCWHGWPGQHGDIDESAHHPLYRQQRCGRGIGERVVYECVRRMLLGSAELDIALKARVFFFGFRLPADGPSLLSGTKKFLKNGGKSKLYGPSTLRVLNPFHRTRDFCKKQRHTDLEIFENIFFFLDDDN
eukprot:286293-Amphidinium_carterae.1